MLYQRSALGRCHILPYPNPMLVFTYGKHRGKHLPRENHHQLHCGDIEGKNPCVNQAYSNLHLWPPLKGMTKTLNLLILDLNHETMVFCVILHWWIELWQIKQVLLFNVSLAGQVSFWFFPVPPSSATNHNFTKSLYCFPLLCFVLTLIQ